MNNNIALSDIRAFVAIAECGSFTAAADALQVSRAHLSRQLSQLEHQLGVQLLIRTTRTQRLTHAGEAFFAKCQSALSGIDQAIVDIRDDNEKLQGPIAINCVGGPLGEDIVAPIAVDFLAQYPGVDIDLDFSSQRVDLAADRFDLVVRMGALDDSRFIARKLADISMVTLVSPQCQPGAFPLTRPEQLSDYNCLVGSIDRWSYQNIDHPDERRDVYVKGNITCKNGRALVKAALGGLGIVRVPEYYCRQQVRDGRLIPALQHWEIPPMPVFALYHAKKYQPRRLSLFLDHLATEFARRMDAG